MTVDSEASKYNLQAGTPIGNGKTFEELLDAFRRFDRDNSGGLDTFELADCLVDIVGRPMTTPEMVRAAFLR
jgi:Ca2+-binding EF-hand superfamily protein